MITGLKDQVQIVHSFYHSRLSQENWDEMSQVRGCPAPLEVVAGQVPLAKASVLSSGQRHTTLPSAFSWRFKPVERSRDSQLGTSDEIKLRLPFNSLVAQRL